MNIEAIQNHIVFQFFERVNNAGEFERDVSHGGIELLKSADDSASQPRWAKIISLGPDCSDILRTPGCEILIDNLKWTAGVEMGDVKLWRTDESHVLVCRYPDGSTDITFEDNPA